MNSAVQAKIRDLSSVGSPQVTSADDSSCTKVAQRERGQSLNLRSIKKAIARDYSGARESWVYFMEDAKGRIKIGFAKNVERRRKEIQKNPDLQCEFEPGPIRLLATIPGNRYAEEILHFRFSFANWHREWFSPVPELLSLIAEIQAQGGTR